jgi:hypothetical protein
MPDAEFGLALFVSGVIFAIGTLLALASGDPDLDPAGLFGAAGALMLLGLVACVAPSLPGRLRWMPPPPPPPPPARASAGLQEANLRATVEASHEVIANQVAAVFGIEAQLVGLIAVLGAGLGLFALVQHSLRDERLILLIGVSCGIATCVWGLFFSSKVDFGPKPTAFYQKLGGSDAADYLAHLVSDLNQTIVLNDDAIGSRRAAAGLTLGVIGLTILVWLVVRAVS